MRWWIDLQGSKFKLWNYPWQVDVRWGSGPVEVERCVASICFFVFQDWFGSSKWYPFGKTWMIFLSAFFFELFEMAVPKLHACSFCPPKTCAGICLCVLQRSWRTGEIWSLFFSVWKLKISAGKGKTDSFTKQIFLFRCIWKGHEFLGVNLGDLGDSRRRPCNPPKTAGSRNESAVRNTSKMN